MITDITPSTKINREISKWIKGTQDRLTVELMINDAMITGELPRFDDRGREWTAQMIMEYAVMITPNR